MSETVSNEEMGYRLYGTSGSDGVWHLITTSSTYQEAVSASRRDETYYGYKIVEPNGQEGCGWTKASPDDILW